MHKLRSLDKKSIFEIERSSAEAWVIGGSKAAKEARATLQANRFLESFMNKKEKKIFQAKIKTEREEAIRMVNYTIYYLLHFIHINLFKIVWYFISKIRISFHKVCYLTLFLTISYLGK